MQRGFWYWWDRFENSSTQIASVVLHLAESENITALLSSAVQTVRLRSRFSVKTDSAFNRSGFLLETDFFGGPGILLLDRKPASVVVIAVAA